MGSSYNTDSPPVSPPRTGYDGSLCDAVCMACVWLVMAWLVQAGSSYNIPRMTQRAFGKLRAADEIIDEGHFIGKVRRPLQTATGCYRRDRRRGLLHRQA